MVTCPTKNSKNYCGNWAASNWGGYPGFNKSRVYEALHESVNQLRSWVKKQPHVHVDESPWPVLGLKEWLWVSAAPRFCLFHAADTRSRTELEQQLGTEFDGIISSDDFSVYNGYPVKAQQKCLAHLRRHFKKVVKLGLVFNPALGQAFLDLIDEAFNQHRYWRETEDANAYQTWAVGFKSRITRVSSNGLVDLDTRRVSYCARYGTKLNSGGISSIIQRCHRTLT
jgi:hypothetical protein